MYNYAKRITETIEELTCLEKKYRNSPHHAKVRMLFLLKRDSYRSIKPLDTILGYSLTQIHRWWQDYNLQGIDGLVHKQTHKVGVRSPITPEIYKDLNEKMIRGEIATEKEARIYLANRWQIIYKKRSLYMFFKRHKMKKKTGRPKHRKTAPVSVQEAFKKNAFSSRIVSHFRL